MNNESALAGIWEMVRAESGGEPSTDLLALRVELHLAADTYVVRFAGEVADRGTFTLGADGSIILVGVEGPNTGRTIPCIYQLVGDRLRICYGLDGAIPSAFATTNGSSDYLATYRRKLR